MKSKLILFLISCIFLLNCKTMPQLGGFLPRVRISQSKKYTVLKEAQTFMSSYQFFGLATVTQLPSFDRAILEKASELGGDDMINVTWHTQVETSLAGYVQYVIIKGTVIKFIE